jgi:hypothetical protein
MSNSTPRLLIGLGDFGLRAIARILGRWHDLFLSNNEPPAVIGVGFDELPAGFPEACYVRLSSDAGAALQRLQTETAPHIESWLDSKLWADRWFHYPKLPRPLERLAWVEEMARGDRSALYQLWLRELRRVRGSRTILALLVADLSDLAGSSLIPDAAFLTHTLADVELNSEVRLWGYTTLPTSAASDDDRLRAFAAMRELSRLLTTHDGTHGDPFHYRPPQARRLDERIWRGYLTSRPLDLWYCFDGTRDAVDSIVGVIGSYLSADAYDKAINHLINVSARTGFVAVGAVNVRSVALPISTFQRAWAAKLGERTATQLLHGSQNRRANAPEIEAEQFLRSIPNANNLETVLVQNQLPPRSVEKWVHAFDQAIFSSATLLPQASAPDALMLRTDSDLPDPASLNLNTICEQRSILRQRVERLRAANNNAYARLVEAAVTQRIEYFRTHLAERMGLLLNEVGVVHTASVCGVLQAQMQRIQASLRQIIREQDRPGADEGRAYQQFIGDMQALDEVCNQSPKLLERRRHLDRARSTLAASQTSAGVCMNRARWSLLIGGLTILLNTYIEIVSTLSTGLAHWRTGLETWQAEWQTIQTQVPEPFAGEWHITTDPSSAWGRQQYERLVTKNPMPTTLWHVAQETLEIGLVFGVHGDQLTLEAAKEHLEIQVAGTFAEAKETSTLLAYLQHEKPAISELTAFLLNAELMPLNIRESQDTTQESFGRFLSPDDLDPDRRALIREIEKGLKRAHNQTVDNDSLIQRQVHDSPHQLLYSFMVERVDLMREVTAYRDMENLYHRYGQNAIYYHALGGEVAAAAIEHRLADPGKARLLLPRVVSALADRNAVFHFFAAYLLDLIDDGPQPGESNDYHFGYRLRLPEMTFWLTMPQPNSLPVLWDAIKTFSAGKQIVFDKGLVPLNVPLEYVFAYIDRRYAERQHDFVPNAPEDVVDDQLRVWLERAFHPMTPSQLREQVVAAAAQCIMLADFRAQLSSRHDNDPVQAELYRVGAALMEERLEAQRKFIANAIGKISAF